MYTKRCFMRTVTFHLHLHYTTSHLSTARTAIQTRRHCQETTAATIVLMNPTPPSSAVCTMYTVKAKFHYSSKLQTWLQTWLSTCVSVSKARRKQVESQLQTCLKPSDDHTWHVEIDAAGLQPGFRQKSRKRVESTSKARCKPARTVTNLSKTWLQTRSKTRFAAG